MTPEGKVKKEITAYLDSFLSGMWYFKPVMMGYGRKGIPDIIGCYRGKFFSIEVKRPGRISDEKPWQEKQRVAISGANGIAIVTDSVDRVHAILSKI